MGGREDWKLRGVDNMTTFEKEDKKRKETREHEKQIQVTGGENCRSRDYKT